MSVVRFSRRFPGSGVSRLPRPVTQPLPPLANGMYTAVPITNHKVWAAKFTARHPNLVALEVSSFKRGHDAPIYGVIEGIIEQSGTPYFCFKDLNENKPSGSVRIRVETIDYFLRQFRDEVIRKRKAAEDIDAQLAALETELRGPITSPSTPYLPEVQEMAAD